MIQMTTFRVSSNVSDIVEGPGLSVESDARASAILGLLGLDSNPHEVRQITMHEARRALIFAVNTWETRCTKFARTYRVLKQGTDDSQAVTAQDETVTWEQLQEDLTSYETLLDDGTKFGSTLLAWS